MADSLIFWRFKEDDIPVKDIIRRFPKSLRNLLGDFSNQANRTRCFIEE